MKKPVVKKEIEIDYNDALEYAKKFKEMIKVKTISYNEEMENGLTGQWTAGWTSICCPLCKNGESRSIGFILTAKS